MTTTFMSRRSALMLGACAALPLGACKPATTQPAKPAATAGGAQHGIDLAGMDTTVQPGDDFFRFANGKWVDATQIPPDQSRWGVFSILADKASRRTSELVADLAKTKAAPGSDEQRIGDYYASVMDEAGVEHKGASPVKPALGRIAAITDKAGLSRALGAQVRADVDPLNNTNFHTPHLFGLWVAQDFNRTERYAPYLLQGGLGMPERAYYLDGSAKMADIRDKYQAYIGNLFHLAGASDQTAKDRAQRVFALEGKIAARHWTAEQSRDVVKANNSWVRADFDRKAPGIDWSSFFDAAGLAGQTDFIAWQPSAITGLSALVGSEPIEAWKDWLAYVTLAEAAPYLSKDFFQQDFDFNSHTLSGTPQQQPRWKLAVSMTNDALGWAVGRLYAQRYFPPQAKAKAQVMVDNILAAYKARIQNLTWMSPSTKSKALEKLATLWVGVGYPDRWRDYSALKVVRGDLYGNRERASLFEYTRNVAKLGGPVDRHEWSMTPQTVNAVNLPVQNGLNFPAAILDAPFFDPLADSAVNYGAIGSVIGHEISHSFDNQGAQFDAAGRLNMWWTPADFAHFTAASQKLARQYDAYAPFGDLHVNGKLTLGENIADVAGLTAAYDGWKASLGGKPAAVLNGYSGEQRYFIGYGQAHRAKFRDEALRKQVLTNEHAPDPYRAATVRNSDAWYAAFSVKPGQKLYLAPNDRVQVW